MVTEHWVLASAKLGRLANDKAYDLGSNKLFANFNFTFNQIESQDQRKLYAMITFNGGNVQKNFDKNVTHLVCGSAQDIIYKKAVSLHKSALAIVTPDWVVDSVKAKSLVNSEIYHPRLLNSPDNRTPPAKPNIPQPTTQSQVVHLEEKKKEGSLPVNVQPQTPFQSIRTHNLPVSGTPRPQLQNRPVVQSMQHTPQQINQILQSQIQQQQKLQSQNPQNNLNQSQLSQVNLPPSNPTSLLQQHAQQAQQQVQANSNFAAQMGQQKLSQQNPNGKFNF